VGQYALGNYYYSTFSKSGPFSHPVDDIQLFHPGMAERKYGKSYLST
jgi:hypothetical protein